MRVLYLYNYQTLFVLTFVLLFLASSTSYTWAVTVCITSNVTSIQECLDGRFAEIKSAISTTSAKYNHQCSRPDMWEQDMTQTASDELDLVYIIQLAVLTSNPEYRENTNDIKIIAELNIWLTTHIGDRYVGSLTGYIARVHGITYSNGATSGHYISVTRDEHTADFFETDDCNPLHTATNLGPTPADSWPKPYMLFYTIQKHVPLQTDEFCGLSRYKNGVETFTLPFGPAMNEQHILLVDGLRNCTAPVYYGKFDGDAWKAQPVQYDGAKMYKVWENLFEQDGPELVQGTVADTAFAVGIVSYADLKGLRDNTYITDGIINAWSN